MSVVSVKQFIEAGVHFGHQTSRWNPKMRRFIHGSKGGIHIIDVKQTFSHLKTAYEYIRSITAEGQEVLFVGTKPQAQEIIKEAAKQCQSHYINERWLGGLLTNFSTVRQSVKKLDHYEELAGADHAYTGVLKKEAVVLERKRQKLERSLGGVKKMESLPGAIFIVDCKKEHLAVQEANRLNIPVIAVVDTNVDPSGIEFPVPGNDDSARSIKLFADVIAAATAEGQKVYSEKVQIEKAKAAEDAAKAKAAKDAAKADAKKAKDAAKAVKDEITKEKKAKADAPKADAKKAEETPAEPKAESKEKEVEASAEANS